MKNALNWFEIFVTDLPRAKRFYEQSLGCSLHEETFGGEQVALFPYKQNAGVGGSLTQSKRFKPAADGPLVYLNADGHLDAILTRVPKAGGAIMVAKTAIPAGFIAIIADTEGNRVGLHSS
ncbi:MAG: VOC family protein [Alphaproteobacteria bacterium]|nr:VOC family protein [Alphaproteobacteria bacterium]